MSVFIRGVDMPTSCSECRFCGGIADTDCGPCAWCDVDGKARDAYTMQDCPLVPVPTPHGDLIEREPLEKKVKLLNAYYSYREVVEYADIHYAPTIIKAEGEDNG